MKKIMMTAGVLLITAGLLCADGNEVLVQKVSDTTATITEKLMAILPTQTVTELLEAVDQNGAGHISRMRYGKKEMLPALAPQTENASRILARWKQKKTVFMIENLYLYKKQADRAVSGVNDVQRVNEIFHAVSTLEGLEYYSTSRKKMRTLYEKSYAVTPITAAKKTVYEKTADDFAATEQLVLQKDLTFGEFIYKYSYDADNDSAGFVCENTEKLKYGVFSLVAPYEMNAALVVIDFGDYFLAYANTRANFAKMPGISEKLQNSFSTRADALYRWFVAQYEKN